MFKRQSWEDNKGYYGYLKCIGPLLIDKEKNLKLDLICDGYDNKNDKFQINLKRNSFEDACIVIKIYISGIGRYLNFINKECTYAVSYFKNKIFGSNKCQISDELFQELKK